MTDSRSNLLSPHGPGASLLEYEPTTVGPYTILGRLGAGGMGTVYLARGPAHRRVAIKVIRPELAADQEFRRRFRREIEAARSVAPFCTAEVLDADPDAPAPYLVTEFIDGTRLDHAVEAGPLSPSTLTGLAIGVATALAAIHRAGLVHRDLKPSNVILSLSGPRVIDFGIAQVLNDGIAKPTAWGFGSTGWMAPEHLNGQPIGPAADVFAWGMLVAYAASGCHPFGSDTDLGLARRITNAEPGLIGLPPNLAGLVRAALAKDPDSRPSARDLLLRLVEQAPNGHGTEPARQLLTRTHPVPRSSAMAAPRQSLGRRLNLFHCPWQAGTAPIVTRRRKNGKGALRPVLAAIGLAPLVLAAIWWMAARSGGAGPDTVDMATQVLGSPTPSSAPSPGGFTDGSLRFTVDGVDCGVAHPGLGFLIGQGDDHFCLITMTVSNSGLTAQRLDNADQYVYDSLGERHTADYAARFYLPGGTVWTTVEPGASIHGTMAFGIPEGAQLDRLELHTSRGSAGATIPVRASSQ